jgi:ATP-dependent RNA helicase DeaD
MSNEITTSADDSAPDSALVAAAAADPAESTPQPVTFASLGLDQELQTALDEMGYFTPTAVQAAVFGPVRDGKDLLVQSRTGTGKTAAFGIPVLQLVDPAQKVPQALILAPTRELALQVSRELTRLAKYRGIVVEPIYGGAPIGKQITNLKNGVHVVVGTPGRVLDHIGRKTLDTRHMRIFILDECDEMLSMGFLEDIERVVSHLSKDKQTLLFSATMPDEVQRYARRHMKAPEKISLSSDNITVSDIHHAYYVVSGIGRSRDLLRIIHAENPESAIIFCNMRDETAMVARYLQKQGLDAEAISSDLSQSERERVMQRMKQHNLRFLVATDVAARGIDISNLSHVFNYSFPDSPELYVHRTGRTGRAGKTGIALSLIGPRELGAFWYLKLQYKIDPEERDLPPWSILDGKLKVPLPALGAPVPPDPIQIVVDAVKGPASEAQLEVVRKLLSNAEGQRVLAVLVAERVSQVLRPKTRRPAPEAAMESRGEDRADRGEMSRDRDEGGRGRDEGRRDARPERGERGDRPERGERDDRPRRWDRDEGGRGRDEGRRDARPERGERGDRPERGERDDRPRRWDRDRPERSGSADRPERGEGSAAASPAESREGTRDSRPQRDDRGRRWDRDRQDRTSNGEDSSRQFDRDGRNRDQRAPAPAAAGVVAEVSAEAATASPTPTATEMAAASASNQGRDRSRREDRQTLVAFEPPAEVRQHRDTEVRLPAHQPPAELAGDEAPRSRRDTQRVRGKGDSQAVTGDSAAATKATDASAKGSDPGRSGKASKSDSGEAPREFWETWADSKASRPAVETTSVDDAAAAPAKRSRGRDEEKPDRRERSRTGKRDDKRDDKRSEKVEDKPERKGRERGKSGSAAPAAAPAAAAPAAAAPARVSGDPVRLFVSLGKTHKVSAADVRTILAQGLGGDQSRIGSVMLRDSHSYVKVPADAAEAIIASLHGKKHNNVQMTVERAT